MSNMKDFKDYGNNNEKINPDSKLAKLYVPEGGAFLHSIPQEDGSDNYAVSIAPKNTSDSKNPGENLLKGKNKFLTFTFGNSKDANSQKNSELKRFGSLSDSLKYLANLMTPEAITDKFKENYNKTFVKDDTPGTNEFNPLNSLALKLADTLKDSNDKFDLKQKEKLEKEQKDLADSEKKDAAFDNFNENNTKKIKTIPLTELYNMSFTLNDPEKNISKTKILNMEDNVSPNKDFDAVKNNNEIKERSKFKQILTDVLGERKGSIMRRTDADKGPIMRRTINDTPKTEKTVDLES